MKEIRLTQGEVAQVDDWNYEWLSQWGWTFGSGYARRRGYGRGSQVFLMHREIMKTPDNLVVDHLDHIRLNNQEYNMRNCTHGQNGQNLKSRDSFQGVSWYKRTQQYIAYIGFQGDTISLGYFSTAEEAALVYNTAALYYYGKDAHLNIIPLL